MTDPVTLAYVHGNEVAYAWTHSLIQLLMADEEGPRRVRRGGVVAMRAASGQLVTARNRAVRYFLDDQRAPWLWMVDTDMGFQPDTLERLVEHADPTARPIVGALCFAQREVAPDGMGGYATAATPTIFDWASDGDGLFAFSVRGDYPADTLIRCAGTGAACLLMHRRALEVVADRYGPTWFDRVEARDGWVGEDLSFCMRLEQVGVPVHVHTGIPTSHFKPVWLAEVDHQPLERQATYSR
jgi:hypothetical protein